jgi:hypothetical protein
MSELGIIRGGARQIAPSGLRYSVKIDPFYREAIQQGLVDDDHVSKLATGRVVRPCRDTVDASFLKCDVKPDKGYTPHQLEVLKLAGRLIGPWITAATLQPDQFTEVNMKSSPGFIWKRKGCRTKLDAFLHRDFYETIYSLEHAPLIDVNPKIEILDIDDIIDRSKVRTTFNPSVDFVVKQKILFEGQNEAMKRNNSNSMFKYGFVKQYGGFGRLGNELARLPMISEHDISGYDRVMRQDKVYDLRRKCLIDYDVHWLLFEWVVFFIVNNLCIGPDGHLYMKRIGNVSGSNNTTSDNMIFHGFIAVDLIVHLYLRRFGCFPTLDQLKDAEYFYIAIYSDDIIMSIDHVYFDIAIEEFDALKRKVYLDWGMTIKETASLTTLTNNGIIDPKHQFLGSYFHYDSDLGTYTPYPRVGMLASSLKYFQGTLTIEQYVMKTACLLLLSAPDEGLFRAVEGFLVFLLRKFGEECLEFLNEHWRNLLLGAQNRRIWIDIAAGREHGVRMGIGVRSNSNARVHDGQTKSKAACQQSDAEGLPEQASARTSAIQQGPAAITSGECEGFEETECEAHAEAWEKTLAAYEAAPTGWCSAARGPLVGNRS